MYSFNKDIGALGESIAEEYLTNIGYIVLDKNFRSKFGEIDIICKDGNYIAFVEVKARYGSIYGTPAESVTAKKQNRIYKTAQLYILKKRIWKFNFRFDVIEVILNSKDNDYSVKLIKDAFQI